MRTISIESAYDVAVTEFRSYENPDGNNIPLDSPRDIANENCLILNGRAYSADFVRQGLTITDAMIISLMRFKINGGQTYIGRDIVLAHVLDSDVLQTLTYLARKYHFGRSHPAKLLMDTGDIVSFWMTESGKRTRYGKPCNGDIVVKSTAPKQYKRNRRNNW